MRMFPAKATMMAMALAAAMPEAAPAMDFDSGNPDIKIRWDNTIKYSTAFRLKDPSSALLEDVNLDDGDRNFKKGIVSNRIDLLSEFDLSMDNTGLRISGAGWYDSVYNRSNDNDSVFTNNSTSVQHNQFSANTRTVMGRDAEILDAFLYTKGQVGDLTGNVRLGKHTLVYGETLFFGANGIANAQGPVDLVKLLSVPGSQFKEILRPVNQLSGTLQIRPNLSVGGYYQLQWKPTRIPPAGSYLSNADFVGAGSERLIAGPTTAFERAPDIQAKNSGQGGMQLRYTPEDSDYEFGLYAARYHDKTPYLYFVLGPTFAPSRLVDVYAQDIDTYGASVTTSVGQLNLAGEVSMRHNTPLVSDPQVILPGEAADNDTNARYAIGNSAHANISGIYVLTPSSLWGGGSVVAELAWNRRLSITRNPGALDPHTTRDATAFRMIFEPAYFQVLPGLDMSVPIGLGYNVDGRSSVVFNFNGGSSHGGDLSIGLNGTYHQVWQFGINYVHYLGDQGTFLTPPNSASPVLSYAQSLKDRDFLSLNIKRAF